jgi:hypothetical protein
MENEQYDGKKMENTNKNWNVWNLNMINCIIEMNKLEMGLGMEESNSGGWIFEVTWVNWGIGGLEELEKFGFKSRQGGSDNVNW